MAKAEFNNLKTRSVYINNTVREDRYNTEDISKEELAFIKKSSVSPRASRTDLRAGDIVVVLEGAHMGKRVVFLKQLENHVALVTGVSSINKVSAFKIDEMYLLKLEASIDIPVNIQINTDNIFESKLGEKNVMECEPSENELKLENIILSSISKVKFMKSYLSEPFKVDAETEFFSQRY